MTLASHITDAAVRIRARIRETPLLASDRLSDAVGAEVWVKAEHLQHTGSFKLRGAFNKLLTLDQERRSRGIIAASSGNHGAAVAHACEALGIAARVFVPEHADPAKVARIREKGVEVVHFGVDGLDTELEARQRAEESGATYVSPYNDPDVIAGQGTVAEEMVRQGPRLDRLYVAVGGGGLIGGIATYLAAMVPGLQVVGALPDNSPVMSESIRAGRIVEVPTRSTLSDGTAGGIEPGAITFEICRSLVHAWVTVSEREIASAMRLWAQSDSAPIEGAAGVAIAGLLRDAGSLAGQRVGVVICGGNIDRGKWDAVLAGPERGEG